MEYAFLDLLNSDWHDWKGSGKCEDRLDKKEWIDEFLSAWSLQIPSADYLKLCSELRNLRTLVSSLIKKIIAGKELTSIDVDTINVILENAVYHKKVITFDQINSNLYNSSEADSEAPSASARFSIELMPVTKDINWVLAKITESFVGVLVERDPKRIKICANPDCGWYFYDESRGLTRNWCDSKACGNLMKVRRFREKSKQGGHS